MRKTKIIATLGPASESPQMLTRLVEAGVNVFRLNMSHAPHDWVRRIVPEIRQAARARHRHVGVLMDTQGPAIRTGDLATALDLRPGQKFTFTVRGGQATSGDSVPVNYDQLVDDLRVGDVVLIDNGEIEMKVLAKGASHLECEVLTPGTLRSRRHINLPGVRVSLPALTAKDLADIQLGLELGVDFIALSFVRAAEDIRQLRSVIEEAPHRPLIVAKIEHQFAVDHLADIIEEADAVMVARGDLGIEVPYEELPIIQRRVVKSCLKWGKPVIVATHMLESMISNPMPTRAEITDVANAVFEQADAIMLSGETTVGKYPLKCVEVFDRIARRIERSGGANYHLAAEVTTERQKLMKSAVVMANEMKASGLLVFTRHGNMARYAAWMRPQFSPIFAVCENAQLAAALSLTWGVYPMVLPAADASAPASGDPIGDVIRTLGERGHLPDGSPIVVVSTIANGGRQIDAMQVRTAG